MTKEKKIRNTDKDERMENPINLQKEKDKNEFFCYQHIKNFLSMATPYTYYSHNVTGLYMENGEL